MTDLRACPFCGHEEISAEARQTGIGPMAYFHKYICDACLAESGDATNTTHSVEIWNARHARPGDTFTGPSGEKLVAVPVEQIIDPWKLDALADWLDIRDDQRGYEDRREVQEDLRQFSQFVKGWIKDGMLAAVKE
jgi:Lar family restriction alleviation protein